MYDKLRGQFESHFVWKKTNYNTDVSTTQWDLISDLIHKVWNFELLKNVFENIFINFEIDKETFFEHIDKKMFGD